MRGDQESRRVVHERVRQSETGQEARLKMTEIDTNAIARRRRRLSATKLKPRFTAMSRAMVVGKR